MCVCVCVCVESLIDMDAIVYFMLLEEFSYKKDIRDLLYSVTGYNENG